MFVYLLYTGCCSRSPDRSLAALQRTNANQLDIVGYQADGNFGTVSVAMCDLASPGITLSFLDNNFAVYS